jgi:hypothetical protein
MVRSRSSWLVGVLACGALLAGCGSSSSTSSTQSSTAGTTAATTTSTATTSRPPALSGAALTQAVTLCKQQIKAQTTLPASAKAKLEGVCEKAAKGDSSSVKQVAREVCEEVVNSSKVPAGAAKEQALAACKAK